MPHWQHTITIVSFCFAPHVGLAADAGLITKQSNHSVADTIQRFEAAVNANAANGWMVFTEIDHTEPLEGRVTDAASDGNRVRKSETGYTEHAKGRHARNRCSAKGPCLGR